MAFTQHTIDTLLELEDGAAAITATEYNSTIVDLGGATIRGTATTARVFGVVEVMVTAMDVANSDEEYIIRILGSNTATVDSGNAQLASIVLGDSATTVPDGDAALLGAARRFLIPFCNEIGDNVYRYIRSHVTCTGTSTSITYTAYASQIGTPSP